MKTLSPTRRIDSLVSLVKSPSHIANGDKVTLMGCTLPWNNQKANVTLYFDTSSSKDMSIGITYLGTSGGSAYHASKSCPISYFSPLSVRVDYSIYSRKHFGVKEFEYYDITEGV